MTNISGHTFDETIIRDTPVILDLGCNKGDFARGIMKMFPRATVISFEPTKGLTEIDSENWTIVNKAIVGSNQEKIKFNQCSNEKSFESSILFKHPTAEEIEVDCQNLNDLISQFRYIDLVKVDIEGAEYEAIESMEEKNIAIPRQWSIEFHDFMDSSLKDKSASIIRKILRKGFKTKYIDDSLMDVNFIS
tara:strand:+ start:2664 stop:3236 length:573 start_codon:yes stop_codon:yes gene_type:complete